METYQINVENIKCGGCINSIKAAFLKLKGVNHVEIDIKNGVIEVHVSAINRADIVKKLAALGYPEKGNNSLLSQAKSIISCAIGKTH